MYDPSDENKNRIIDELRCGLSLSRLSAIALMNRGYESVPEAESFIKNETVLLHDPFLLPDMEKAAETILSFVDSREPITVYGDYDADGVTATTVLYMYLTSLRANVNYYIPDRRTEGYGMNIGSVERIAAAGTKLIITVDNGVTAVDEIGRAKELGVTVVVTDHHSPHEVLPEADALVDPHLEGSRYPFPTIAGVGVAFKTVCAVETLIARREGRNVLQAITRLCLTYTDLVAIGTVADVMPIRDENRLLTAMGLRLMRERPSLGIDALIYASSLGDNFAAASPEYYASRPRETNKKKINAGYISFTIAPRINAAGRVTHAYDAVELFLSATKREAMARAVKLCEINSKRKSIENLIADSVIERIEQTGKPMHKIIVMDSDEWKNGVVGIVASRIMEKYSLPVVLVSYEDSIADNTPSPEDAGKGSCRSIPGFSIHDALAHCEELFLRYGGHELAAGLTIKRKNFPAFKEKIEAYADSVYDSDASRVTVDIDCEADFSELTVENINELGGFEPYGIGNPQPVFATFGANVREVRALSDGKYAKLVLEKNGQAISALSFNCSYDSLPVGKGDSCDVAYGLEVNEYKGFTSPQITLKDIRMSEKCAFAIDSSIERALRFTAGEDIVLSEHFIPERKDFALLFGYARYIASLEKPILSLRRASSAFREEGYTYFEPWMVLLLAKVFEELGLLKLGALSSREMRISIPEVSEKRDLSTSKILQRYIKLHQKQI